MCTNNNVTITSVLLLIIALISPYLFTLPCFWERFNFSETGSIGSTIGGITAPFIGLLNAFLLYKTLIEQVRYNQRTFVLSLIESLNQQDSSFSVVYSVQSNEIAYSLRRLRSVVADYDCSKDANLTFPQSSVESICDFFDVTILKLNIIKELSQKASSEIKCYVDKVISDYAMLIVQICEAFISSPCMIVAADIDEDKKVIDAKIKTFRELKTLAQSVLS